jgi:hypothetical protein
MSDRCALMEKYCLEQSRLEPKNRGKWIVQAERWHELGRAQESWRKPKKQQAMDAGPKSQQQS